MLLAVTANYLPSAAMSRFLRRRMPGIPFELLPGSGLPQVELNVWDGSNKSWQDFIYRNLGLGFGVQVGADVVELDLLNMRCRGLAIRGGYYGRSMFFFVLALRSIGGVLGPEPDPTVEVVDCKGSKPRWPWGRCLMLAVYSACLRKQPQCVLRAS